MSTKKIISIGLISVSLLTLSACSMFGDKDKSPHSAQKAPSVVESMGDTETSAIEPNSQFQSVDNGQATDAANSGDIAMSFAETFHFDFDDATLQEADKALLQRQAAYLKEHPSAHILLGGHTDERGSREYNVALGERRAQTVAEFLRVLAVRPEQIRLVSYGQEKPVAFVHNETAWKQNRRVELSYEAKA